MSSNKPWVYVALGAGALVATAVVVHLLTSKSSGSSHCFDEIDSLGAPKKEPNGLLSFGYFKELFGIVSKYAKQKFADEKKDLTARRRKALKEGNEQLYKEIVKEMMQREEMVFGELLQDSLEHIGVNEQEFMQMQQIYMSNPQTQQILMQAQMSSQPGDKPKLTRQKTKELYLEQEEKKMESMKKMFSNPGMQQQDPMEGMITLMVEQAKMADEMFEKTQVEEEEFTIALIHHNIMQDPEIMRIQMENMRKLGFGGMGGFGGM